MDKKVGPGQVFFFGNENSKVDDMIGINTRCHIFLPPPGGLERVDLSDGPLGFAPQVLFRERRFVRSDWIVATFPETFKDIKRIKSETKKLFRKFRRTEAYRKSAATYKANARSQEPISYKIPDLPPFTTADGKEPESHPGIDALFSTLFDFDTIMRGSPTKIM